MDEPFFVLLILGALALVAIGFFTVLYWLSKLFGGAPAARPEPVKLQFTETAPVPRQCAACRAALTSEDRFCMICGTPTAAPAQDEMAAAKRVLLRLFNAKRIDEASFQQVLQALVAAEGKQPERVRETPPVEPQPMPAATREPVAAMSAAPPEAVTPAPAPAIQPAIRPAIRPASEPRRSFTEMLGAFMEESSIRWGELIGGLLIIGSSLALVVSLWSEIAERPVLKFGLFMTLVAGLFGLGFYSAHRWKLPTTSRGVLLTATLLTPLYFLAVVAFGRTTAASAGIVLAEAGSWLVLAVLVWLAARVVALEQQRWLTVGTLGASLALLLGKHFAASGAGMGLNWRSWLLLGALPVLGCVASVGAAVRAARRSAECDERAAYGLFTVLGVNVFAALLPLGLLQVRAGNWTHALRENAPLLALLGLPALAVGWLLWRRLGETGLAGERTVAASVGLCGALLLVGSALLAFPFVDSLLAIALLNAALFGWAAWRYELRAARWVALAQAVWAYALLGQLALGRLAFGQENARQLWAAVLSYSSAVFLIAVFVILSCAAEWLRANKREALAREFAVASWLMGAASLLLVTLHGFAVAGDPKRVAWVYGVYALAAFVLGWRRNDVRGSWLGWLLLGAANLQTVVFKLGWPQGWVHAWIVCWLVLAAAGATVALLTVWGSDKARALLGKPALQVAWGYAAWASVAMLARNSGLHAWHVVPLALTVLACVVYARRCASEVAAWAGGLLFNAAVTVAYVVWVKNQGGQPGEMIRSHELARVAQWNLLAGAAYALGWRWAVRSVDAAWLNWQARALTFAAVGLLVVTALRLVFEPAWPSEFARTFGDGLGWVAVAGVAACYAHARQGARALPGVRNVALALLALGALLACTLQRFEHGHWLSYHTLLATAVAVAWAMLWLVLLASRATQFAASQNRLSEWLNALLAQTKATADDATWWALGLSAAAVWLSLFSFEAPGGPWRGVIAVSAIAALMIGLAVGRRNGAYVYAAGALVCTALTLWIFGYSKGGGTLLDVALLNVTALAGVGLLSLWLELKVLRATPVNTGVPAFHQFTVALLLALTCLKVGGGLWLDFVGAAPLPVKGWIGSLALVAVLLLCLGCVWDAQFAYRFVALFVAGLATVGALVDRQNLQAQALLVWTAVALSAYGLLLAGLWRQREALAVWLRQARVPQLDWRGDAGLWWLTKANAFVAAGAVLAAGWASLAVDKMNWRVAAASAALFAPCALGALAKRMRGRVLAVALAFAALVIWSWAWVNRLSLTAGFQRLTLLLAWALGCALAFHIAEAARGVDWAARLGDWEQAWRRVLFGLSVIGLSTLGAALLIEWVELGAAGTVPAPFWTKALLTLVLATLTGACIGFAMWRGRDPFDLATEQRGRYVYAAEICAVLLLAHVRMIAPWLFTGAFKQYWPLIVLALAFVGVGVSEQLRRRGRVVLAEPLARTGVFLPLLPSLGFWLIQSRVDYAGLLLAVGLFYGLLSVLRQSFGFGLLAALAGNGGWWHWLHRTEDFGFLSHPQVWLIPAALSVMVAAHWNREQLSQEQMTSIRYAALITIYVSSTADIFINGVANSPLGLMMPLVLAVLSVAGVLLGLLLRVRAYLFLGTAFLLLALITMVWHAALSLGWGWLWYVSGIAFGVFILYLFALFERRRAELLGLVERLKTWQA